MRFCTSVSLVIHRYSIVRFIYIYICVYTELSFETDRSSLFVANIRIYMYRNINIYKNTKKWEWWRGGEGKEEGYWHTRNTLYVASEAYHITFKKLFDVLFSPPLFLFYLIKCASISWVQEIGSFFFFYASIVYQSFLEIHTYNDCDE